MKTLVITNFLLTLTCHEYQEKELMKRIANYFHFDHHLFMLDETRDVNRFINVGDPITPQSLYKLPLDSIRIEVDTKNTFVIVVPHHAEFKLKNFADFLDPVQSIQSPNVNMKVGVFFTKPVSIQDLRQLFEWCKLRRIFNVIAVTHFAVTDDPQICFNNSLNVFTFNPFGTVDVINVTSLTSFNDWFAFSRKANFHQHTFRIGRFEKSYKIHREIWLTVLRMMNASFVEVNCSTFPVAEDLMQGIDISTRHFGQLNLDRLRVQTLALARTIVMVPEALPYSDFSTYLRNAGSGMVCGCAVTSIMAAILTLIFVRYIELKKVSVLRSAVDIFQLAMNDNMSIKYRELCRSEASLIVPFTFVGLIVVNGVLSNLKSHLTRPLIQSQINTVDELYRADYPIYVLDLEWRDRFLEYFSSRSKYAYEDWSSKVIYLKGYQAYGNVFNRTMAFQMSKTAANVLLQVQKLLNVKGYYDPDLRVSSRPYSYQVNETFLYFERLNEIILRMQSSGLFDWWTLRDLKIYEGKILRQNAHRLGQVAEEVDAGWPGYLTWITYGWIAALIVFVCEIVWKKIERKRKA